MQNRTREERTARRDSSWVLYKVTLTSTNEQKVATWVKKLHKALVAAGGGGVVGNGSPRDSQCGQWSFQRVVSSLVPQ